MQAHPKKIWSVVYLQASRRCLKPQYCCTTTTSTSRKKFSYAGSRSTKTSYSTSPMSCSSCELHMIPTHFFNSNIFIENSLYWTICKENEQDFSRNLSLLLVALWAPHACSLRVFHEYYPFHSTPTFFSEAHKSSVSSVSSIGSLGWYFCLRNVW